MTNENALYETSIKSLEFLHRGKVRDIYAVDDEHLLIIQTDRLSAFDVILPTAVPGKGKVLTAISNFWFERLTHIVPNHLTGIAPESVVSTAEQVQVIGRSFVVKRLKPLAVEAIVRGYVVGSGWKDYQKTGAICGIALPDGLQEAEKLPTGAIFTPSTKAAAGAVKAPVFKSVSNEVDTFLEVSKSVFNCNFSVLQASKSASSLAILSLQSSWLFPPPKSRPSK
mgnify:CR=1 FL=1